jgi:hypothetical protein
MAQNSHLGGITMFERALPIPQVSTRLSVADVETRHGADALEFIRSVRDRVKQLLRALVDFFANGGPLS